MVKLWNITVLYKGSEVKVLKWAHDLGSVNYFQKKAVQEFLSFVSQTIVERTQLCCRQSVKEGEYMCHVYVRADGLAGVIVSDEEYPNRVAHTLLTKVLDDFASQVDPSQWDGSREVVFSQLPVLLAKYQDPSTADSLTRIQLDLDETKIILRNTIQEVLERGEKLDDLVAKSEGLSIQSKAFYKTAKKTNSCCST